MSDARKNAIEGLALMLHLAPWDYEAIAMAQRSMANRDLRYMPIAANRYALKIEVENGVVTGWDG